MVCCSKMLSERLSEVISICTLFILCCRTYDIILFVLFSSHFMCRLKNYSYYLYHRTRFIEHILQSFLTPASQVEVGCPRARGLQPQLLPKADEHPQAYQPATQPRAPSRPAPPPPTIAPMALRLEAQWK